MPAVRQSHEHYCRVCLVKGLVNTSDVLVDWPEGRRDNYVISQLNSVANAFGYYGLTALADIATWIDRYVRGFVVSWFRGFMCMDGD